MQKFITLAFVLFSAVQLRAEMSVKEFLSILAADNSTMTLTLKGYIQGLGEGMQATALATEKSPLFCAPEPNLGFDVYSRILQRIIKDYSTTVSAEELGDTQVSVLLLVGLKREYPCKKP